MADDDDKPKRRNNIVPQRPTPLEPRPQRIPEPGFFGVTKAKKQAEIAEAGVRIGQARVEVLKADVEFNKIIEESKFVVTNVQLDQELHQLTKQREIEEEKRKIANQRRSATKDEQLASKQSLEQRATARMNLEKATELELTQRGKTAVAAATARHMAELAHQIAAKQVSNEDLKALKENLELLRDIHKTQNDIGEYKDTSADQKRQRDDPVTLLKRHAAGDNRGLSPDERLFISFFDDCEVEAVQNNLPPPASAVEVLRIAKTKRAADMIDDDMLFAVEKVARDLSDL